MARIARTQASTIKVSPRPDFTRERRLMQEGRWPVAGVDEVGRGPLAGPVVAAAVILDPDAVPEGLADSKAMAPDRRELLYARIVATAHVAVASVPASRIDVINIREATLEAMRRALRGLAPRPAFILVDGRDLPTRDIPGEAVVRGDGIVASISAASIVAKVTRDRLMARLGRHFPAYGFERHAGYATAAHRAAIVASGPCPYHRLSFGPLFSGQAGDDHGGNSFPA